MTFFHDAISKFKQYWSAFWFGHHGLFNGSHRPQEDHHGFLFASTCGLGDCWYVQRERNVYMYWTSLSRYWYHVFRHTNIFSGSGWRWKEVCKCRFFEKANILIYIGTFSFEFRGKYFDLSIYYYEIFLVCKSIHSPYKSIPSSMNENKSKTI